jgi:predicted acetyltransferase
MTADDILHPVPVQDAPAWIRAMAVTFLDDPHGPATARRIGWLSRTWDPDRVWGARDRGRWVATLRTEPRTLTVPGRETHAREISVDALTNVTVAATHRRRGLLSAMVDRSLRAARERADPISMLIAAEWPIYGRYGYAPATLRADYALVTHRPGSRCSGDPSRVRQVDRDEFTALAPEVFAAARRRRAGQVDRDGTWWQHTVGTADDEPPRPAAHNWFVHDGDGGPDGLLGWSPMGEFRFVPPRGSVAVWDLTSATDTAYRNLWAYLSGIDAVEHVTVPNRPVDEPVRWLLGDARTLTITEQVDALWLRLLDVPAALTARRYSVPGDLVLEVLDEAPGGYGAGRFALRADGDEVACEPTARDVDVVITQTALASIYLGGVRLHELTVAQAAQESTPGALARLALMFATPLAPWNATSF